MKILTHTNIMDLNISPLECYQWVNDMIKNKSATTLPPKVSMIPSEGRFLTVMPSMLHSNNGIGVKIVTRYPDSTPSLNSQIILYDSFSGNIKALLDGNYITTMRTGAVAAHSIRLLAKEKFQIIGWIGLGNQARATFKVLAAMYPNEKFVFKLKKYKNQHELFKNYIEKIDNQKRFEFIECNSYEETIRGSDVIISSATYFDKNICEDDCFDEGCLVVPIHTRGFMNCDLFCDRVFVDDIGHVKGFKYFEEFKNLAEVTDIVNNRVKGRESNKERIIVYNVGISIHDIYFAEKIYKLAEMNHQGQLVSLDSPQSKFWI